jgi:transposase
MNVFLLLKEYAGLGEKEVPEWFVITESETETVLKPIRHLDGPTFNAVYKMAVDHEGTYDNTPGARCFHIPKAKNPMGSPSNEKLETALGHVPEATEDYVLSRSLKGKLGQLVPCLEDAEGIVFDGLHRKRLDPKAWTVKIDRIKTPVDRALARMTVNFCRRHYTSDEMKNDIGLLIGSGLSVEQIIEVTGISESTIYKYKPQELKDTQKVEAGRLGGISAPSSEQTVKTQDTAQPQIPQRIQRETLNEIVECASCHMGFHISRATLIDDKNVCPRCAERAKPQSKPKVEVKEFKPKETGDFRVALMQPQKSKFELAVIQELQAEGLPLETDQDICVVKTRPDAVLRLQKANIAIYIDNEATHPEGNGRDEFLRDKIEAQGWKVLPLRWKNDTEKERQQAKEQVREFLKW